MGKLVILVMILHRGICGSATFLVGEAMLLTRGALPHKDSAVQGSLLWNLPSLAFAVMSDFVRIIAVLLVKVLWLKNHW